MSLLDTAGQGVPTSDGPNALSTSEPVAANATAPARASIDSDNCLQWLSGAHEMLVSTIMHGTKTAAAPRYIEQYATASRTLIVIPAGRPELSRAIDFSRAPRDISGLKKFQWHEMRREINIGDHDSGRRHARIRAEFESVDSHDLDASMRERAMRCVTVTSLEWLQHSLKPRTLSFAICYDEKKLALGV